MDLICNDINGSCSVDPTIGGGGGNTDIAAKSAVSGINIWTYILLFILGAIIYGSIYYSATLQSKYAELKDTLVKYLYFSADGTTLYSKNTL